MQKEQYSIVVKIEEPQETVFIAMPFNTEFDAVYAKISEAVISVNLIPDRIDKNIKDPDFIRDIKKRIQNSQIVVVDCSPETKSEVPNPNVMFELGLAISIGKPVIIMTNDIETLPSDLKNINVFKCKKNDINTDSLSNWLHEAKNRVQDKLIDEYEKDIWVAKSKHWLFTKTNLSESFIKVLTFAKEAHNLLHDLFNSHLDRLKTESITIAESKYNKKQLNSINIFDELWKRYVQAHEKGIDEAITNKLHPFTIDKTDVDNAFKTLEMTWENLLIFEAINKFYESLKKYLNDYQTKHTLILEAARISFIELHKTERFTELYSSLAELSRIVESGLIDADKLLLNLIKTITDGGDDV